MYVQQRVVPMSFGQTNNTVASYFTRPSFNMRFAFPHDIVSGNNEIESTALSIFFEKFSSEPIWCKDWHVVFCIQRAH